MRVGQFFQCTGEVGAEVHHQPDPVALEAEKQGPAGWRTRPGMLTFAAVVGPGRQVSAGVALAHPPPRGEPRPAHLGPDHRSHPRPAPGTVFPRRGEDFGAAVGRVRLAGCVPGGPLVDRPGPGRGRRARRVRRQGADLGPLGLGQFDPVRRRRWPVRRRWWPPRRRDQSIRVRAAPPVAASAVPPEAPPGAAVSGLDLASSSHLIASRRRVRTGAMQAGKPTPPP